MIDARYRELDQTPMTPDEALAWTRDTGGRAAELAVRILDPDATPELAHAAGAAWALGKRADGASNLAELTAARRAVRGLSAAAFPAVAHATLSGRSKGSELGRRLRLMLAVARGRI
jgi:phytoene synthase